MGIWFGWIGGLRIGLVMGTVIVVTMIMVVLEPQCLVGVAGKEYLVFFIYLFFFIFFELEKKNTRERKPKSLAMKSLFVRVLRNLYLYMYIELGILISRQGY